MNLHSTSTLSGPEEGLEDVILSYLTAVDDCQAPDRHEFLNRHPQFASELAAFFADQDQTVSYVAPLRNIGPAGSFRLKDSSFGDYEVIEEVARGGMGVIFKARQISLNRVVALKMILAGHLASAADVQRFRTEAEACAHMDHPHIVPIFDVGEHRGQHYFSMRFMEGGSLAQALDNGQWPVGSKEDQRRSAQLLATVTRAVKHAHERGVLHRDLKPGNILFDSHGRPHVCDFGLAKRVQEAADGTPGCGASLTQGGALVGTPSYMAPEQTVSPRGLTIAADIYSLGVILYELLTGKPPFRADTPLETMRQVKDVDAERPRALNPTIDRDLETIALKCLEKDRRRRYSSAAALAEDLERWLAGEPIRARPVGASERALKWARRRPAAAALFVLLAGSFLLSLGAVIWNWQAAETARRQATARANAEAEAKRRLAVSLYFRNIALARFELAEINVGRANLLLDQCDRDLRGWEWHFLNRQCHADLMTLRTHAASVVGLAFSADGQRLASVSSNYQVRNRSDERGNQQTASLDAGEGGSIRIFRAADGHELLNLRHKADPIFRIALSPDGKRVAFAGGKPDERTGFVKVFDTTSGQELFSLVGHTALVRSVTYSHDGRRMASASADETAKIWDAETGQLLRNIDGHDIQHDVAFSPDDSRLASASCDRTARIWDATTGRELFTLKGHKYNVTRVAFSPDGQRLATASEDHTIKVWKADTGRELLTLAGHTDGVAGVAFSPDSRRIVSASYDNTTKVWDSVTGLVLFTFVGHTAPVMDVAYSPDGQRLASASLDKTIKFWNAQRGHAVEAFPLSASLSGLVYSPDGRHVAGGGPVGEKFGVLILNVATGKEVQTLKGHEGQIDRVAYSPNGRRLASASYDKSVRVWDLDTGRTVLTMPGHRGRIYGMAYSPDGNRLATGGENGTAKIWDAGTGKELFSFDQGGIVDCVAFSRDSRRLASTGHGLKVRDAATGKELYALDGYFGLALFTADGSRLLALGHEVKLLDAATGCELKTLHLPAGTVLNIAAISSDGRRLALPQGKAGIVLWDTETDQEALTLRGHTANVRSLAFSPDGHQIASVDGDGTMIVWDATRLP
jgi:eukaryotic-like serine/threonine-protein kinase